MAVITKQIMLKMWRDIFRKSEDKAAFKGTVTGLSLTDIQSALQALEDDWQARKGVLKKKMDAAVGKTLTIDQAKALGRAWLKNLAERGNN